MFVDVGDSDHVFYNCRATYINNLLQDVMEEITLKQNRSFLNFTNLIRKTYQIMHIYVYVFPNENQEVISRINFGVLTSTHSALAAACTKSDGKIIPVLYFQHSRHQ